MAFSRTQVGSATGNDTAPQVTLGAAPAQGALLVAHVATNGNLAQTTASGWTRVPSGVIVSTDNGCVYYKVAGASESATQAPATIANGKWICIVGEWAGPDTLEVETGTVDNDATKMSGTVDPTDGIEILIIGASFVNSGAAYSAEKVNGSTSGVTEDADLTNTNVVAAALWDKIEASSAAGNYTVECTGGNANGGVHIAIFKASGGAPPATPPRRSLLGVGV